MSQALNRDRQPASQFALEFGRRLEAAMSMRQLTQTQLWRQSGVPQAHIHRLLTCQIGDPSSLMIRNLAIGLDVSTDYLMGMYDGDRRRYLMEGRYVAPVYAEGPSEGDEKRGVSGITG